MNSKTFVHVEIKQNHQNSPNFQLTGTVYLFCARKQGNQNEAMHLEMGFPKIMMKINYISVFLSPKKLLLLVTAS